YSHSSSSRRRCCGGWNAAETRAALRVDLRQAPHEKIPAAAGIFLTPGRDDSGCRRHDTHDGLLARALGPELDLAIDQREQGVVLADANIHPGMNLGPALTHDDRARRNRLAAERLYAQTFGLGIAAVTRTAACFFVCHIVT